MEIELSAVEQRVLGVLIEKELTTPEYYPLTQNALVAACNQKSNREPVMALSEAEILPAIERLRGFRLAWVHSGAGSRVAKYSHNISSIAPFEREELSILCELLVRGPQTPGELRTRSSRMAPFADTPAVERVLAALATNLSGPFVRELARQPGRRENRWAQLFGAVVESSAADSATPIARSADTAASSANDALAQRVEALEERVRLLEETLKALGG